MSTDKKLTLFKAVLVSQFNYCPLMLMFYTKQLNNQLNSLHEKELQWTYLNRNLSFDEILKLDKSVAINHIDLQYLLTEIHKVKMGLSPPIMIDILALNNNASYNFKIWCPVTRSNIRTNKFYF